MIITLELAKEGATLIVAATGLATLIKGVLEYTHQAVQRRAERFLAMRQRLQDNEVFKTISVQLENDDQKLEDIPFAEKRDFLGLYEEVALMLNSRVIKPEVAYYMYGYYAIKCGESIHFWNNINKESVSWALFKDFYLRMKQERPRFKFSRRKLRF